VIVEESDYAKVAQHLTVPLRDPRVALITNSGVRLAGAFNTGMRHAQTTFVAILLGDDLLAPEAIEVLVSQIESLPEIDFFHSARRVIDDTGEPLSSVHPSRRNITLDDFKTGAPVKHLLCWRRKKALSFGGMDETSRSIGPDDFDFPWMMAEHDARFSAVQECLYLYRDHRTGYRLTTHLPRSLHRSELRRVLRKHGLGRIEIEKRVWRANRGYLRECLYRSRLDRWWKERSRSVKDDPPWRQTYS
jgi:glycosyltransferase involved in cell wall biosynthesis